MVLVGQSLGGFTVPLVEQALADSGTPPRAIVFVNAMIPEPGETHGAWWDNVDQSQARRAAAEQHQRPEADAVFGSVCDFAAWPDVPIRVVAGADDRFFPVAFQQRVARERLGVDPVVIPGGHLVALSQPEALADALTA